MYPRQLRSQEESSKRHEKIAVLEFSNLRQRLVIKI